MTSPTFSEYIPGRHYFGTNGYVEYIAGNLPIIISIGHGGTLTPDGITDRVDTAMSDHNTIALGLAISDAFRSQLGRAPHVVLCLLKRTKLDVNRSIDSGAFADSAAAVAWREYHAFIDSAARCVTLKSGRGCYVDLHGHAHAIQRLELGYLLGPQSLNLTDSALIRRRDHSSIRALGYTTDSTFGSLVRGPGSIGGLMQAAGFPSVPSPQYSSPGSDPYFGGGYSVVRHGSRDGGAVSGFQLECNFTGVRDTPENQNRFAALFAKALQRYFVAHFKMVLEPVVATWPFIEESEARLHEAVFRSSSFDVSGRIVAPMQDPARAPRFIFRRDVRPQLDQ